MTREAYEVIVGTVHKSPDLTHVATATATEKIVREFDHPDLHIQNINHYDDDESDTNIGVGVIVTVPEGEEEAFKDAVEEVAETVNHVPVNYNE